MQTPGVKYLSVTDASWALKLSGQRVKQLFDEGKLHGFRDSGGRRVIAAESVESLRLQRGRARPDLATQNKGAGRR